LEGAPEKSKPAYQRSLVFTSQAGMVNNMNDSVVWGLLPVLLFDSGLLLEQVAVIVSIYPAVWGMGQLIMGYPTLLAAVSDSAPEIHRSRSLGIYRFFRDSGFAFGALIGGAAADRFGIPAAMGCIGALTFLSGLVYWLGNSGKTFQALMPVSENK